VVSTVLLVTGMTTLLHMFVGTRLPLVQGPSFVYLAPALAIMNSPEFFGLNDNVCIYFELCYGVAVPITWQMSQSCKSYLVFVL
jgi:nucleobase transporter 1/2